LTSKSDIQKKNRIEEMAKKVAKKTGVTFDQAAASAAAVLEVYEAEKASRRSTENERTLLRAELGKLDVQTLRDADSRALAAKFANQGLAIRPKAQGVISFISRTRKQLLLVKGDVGN
jgi:hypothetical protein